MYAISVAAELVGMGVQTLRLYEARGLLEPDRTDGGTRRYSEGASDSVESAMHRRKRGTLRSGPGGKGGKVTSRKQAIAIGLSEARKKGAKVPKKRASRS